MTPPLGTTGAPRLRVVFLTAQTDPRGCELSPLQERFLRSLPLEDAERGERNFPFRPGPAHREMPVPAASRHVGAQLARSALPGFGPRYRPEVTRELRRAARTLVLAGSCGLELLRVLDLDAEVLRRVHVLAYGPVSRGLPACGVTTVVADGDRISRLFRPRVDHRVPGGHLDYLHRPEMRDLATQVVARQRACA